MTLRFCLTWMCHLNFTRFRLSQIVFPMTMKKIQNSKTKDTAMQTVCTKATAPVVKDFYNIKCSLRKAVS